MENYKLQLLSDMEKTQAENNHGLVYSFLHRHGYSIEEFYNIAIFGYLKGIQIYNRRKDLQNKYHLAFICCQYMRAEVRNYLRCQNSKKRKPSETLLSLDADGSTLESLCNCVDKNSFNPELELMETELLSELLENVTATQQRIVAMKMEGYSNKETYIHLKIKPSTYYKQLERIRSVMEKVID